MRSNIRTPSGARCTSSARSLEPGLPASRAVNPPPSRSTTLQNAFRRSRTDAEPEITPFLWYDTEAEEAANLYVSIFKNSRVHGVSRYGDAGQGRRDRR